MITLSQDQILHQAQRHHDAEANRKQIKATTLEHPDMTMDDAYAIQNAWKGIKVKEGRKVIGHKIGLT